MNRDVFIPLGLIMLVAFYLLVNGVAWHRAARHKLRRRIFYFAIYAALLLTLVWENQIPAAFGIGVFSIPFLMRVSQITAARRRRSIVRSYTQPTAKLETPFLIVRVNHHTKSMSGEILQGNLGGAHLEQLSLDDFMQLLSEYKRLDPRSAGVLMTYLDHTQGDWRTRARAQAHHSREHDSLKTKRSEALAMLGLTEGATAEDIKLAHRRLMMRLHPDQGGTDYLAAKVNEAKDILLA